MMQLLECAISIDHQDMRPRSESGFLTSQWLKNDLNVQ